MGKNKTHSDKTSADTILVAFDYQYYYFLWKLFSLRPGESVGLEVKDDVHTELNNNEQIYFQVKHTVKKKADKTPENLTESDADLWKTMSNWSKIVADSNDGRQKEFDQINFIKRTSFVLASNKSSSNKNSVLKFILDYQEKSINLDALEKIILDISNNSDSENLKNYIDNVLSLGSNVLEYFLNKVFFNLDEDDIILKCKEAIKSDKIIESKIDHVFSKLDSSIRADNFFKIRNDCKIQITFDEFYLCTRQFRNPQLKSHSHSLIQ